MSSPASSPGHRRKRLRLSSPTYDEQVELSQEEVAAFDEFERRLTQPSRKPSHLKPSQVISSHERCKRDEAIAAALGFKDLPEADNFDQSSQEHSRSPSPCLSARKENQKPFDIDRAYSPPYSRTSPITSPSSPSKHQPRPPKQTSGSISAASLSNPFTSNSPSMSPTRKPVSGFTSALQSERSTDNPDLNPKTVGLGFTSALNIINSIPADNYPSSSPDEPPPQQDLSECFQSADVSTGMAGFTSARALRSAETVRFKPPSAIVGFQSASTMKPTDDDGTAKTFKETEHDWLDDTDSLPLQINTTSPSLGAPSGFAGFTTGKSLLNTTAKGNSCIAPSEAALKKATELMKRWEKEINREFPDTFEEDESVLTMQIDRQFRPISAPLNEHLPADALASPSPAGPGVGRPLGFSTLSGVGIRDSKQPFKSPLFVTPDFKPSLATRPQIPSSSKSSPAFVSPLNPNRPPRLTSPARPASAALPLVPASASFSTPVRPGLETPQKKALGMSSRRVSGGSTPAKKAFSTPFKSGMRPGESGRLLLQQPPQAARISPESNRYSSSKGKNKEVSPTSNGNTSLASSGLVPQAYSSEELQGLGLNTVELSQINPQTALYYAFHSASPVPPTASQKPPTQATLGTMAAYNELQMAGCKLATLQWVENHWTLILWKLAGMAALEPQTERDPNKKRWCWTEVMRQLRYRYDRELNGTARPALRLITTQDAPASCPMVLCVSNIIWPSEGDEGAIPELEITDGWYRLRAQIDAPLIRAMKKGTIKVGKKVAVTGCRLESDKKEPAEILEAYDSVSLKIYGNSSHLAPWHAKLGFQSTPFVCSLRSLTSDGGLIAVIDVVVEKAYPIAFLETFEDEDGQKRQEGPWNEKEEHVAYEKWRARREVEAGKLRNAFEGEMQKWEIYAERLQRRAGSKFKPGAEESPPEHIEDLLLELEDAPNANETLKDLSLMESGWLAQLIQQKIDKDRQRFYDSMEQELNAACPPRQVRNFRVIQVRDAQSFRRPALRTAQITVWEVLNLHTSEGGAAGNFVPGQRFMITNVLPSQKGAWGRNLDQPSMIYMVTRRDSRFTRIR